MHTVFHRNLQKKMLYLLEKQRQGRHKDISFYPEKFRFMPLVNTAVTVTISLVLDLIILSSVVKRVPMNSSCFYAQTCICG